MVFPFFFMGAKFPHINFLYIIAHLYGNCKSFLIILQFLNMNKEK